MRLIKYFLASLTIPENDLWVNLSPYEKDRIIPRSFGLTEMGRDLLAEDYMLKQITASLIYPEDAIGKKFWKRVYEEAEKKFGTTNVPVNTFNKVWIVPEKAVVYENVKAGTAYVVEARLKVMLEQDYLSLAKHINVGVGSKPVPTGINKIGSQIIREIVIPELTKEVNEGRNFAQLRQVYNSLILATWYKRKIKDSILEQVYADKNKTAGVRYTSTVIPAKAGIHFKNDVEGLYREYLKAFKKGVFNYIKEDIDPATQEIVPRKYFSGGLQLKVNEAMMVTSDPKTINFNGFHKLILIAALGLPLGLSQRAWAQKLIPRGGKVIDVPPTPLKVAKQKLEYDYITRNDSLQSKKDFLKPIGNDTTRSAIDRLAADRELASILSSGYTGHPENLLTDIDKNEISPYLAVYILSDLLEKDFSSGKWLLDHRVSIINVILSLEARLKDMPSNNSDKLVWSYTWNNGLLELVVYVNGDGTTGSVWDQEEAETQKFTQNPNKAPQNQAMMSLRYSLIRGAIVGLSFLFPIANGGLLNAQVQNSLTTYVSPNYTKLSEAEVRYLQSLNINARPWSAAPSSPLIIGELNVAEEFFPENLIRGVKAIYVLPPQEFRRLIKDDDGGINLMEFDGIDFSRYPEADPRNTAENGYWERFPLEKLFPSSTYIPTLVYLKDREQHFDMEKFSLNDRHKMETIFAKHRSYTAGRYYRDQGFIILESVNRKYNRYFLAHELGHCWFENLTNVETIRHYLYGLYEPNTQLFDEVSGYAEKSNYEEALVEIIKLWVKNPSALEQFNKNSVLRVFVKLAIDSFSSKSKKDPLGNTVTIRFYKGGDSGLLKDVEFPKDFNVYDVIKESRELINIEDWTVNNNLSTNTGGIDLTPANMNLQTKVEDSRLRGNDSNEGGSDRAMIAQNDEGIKFHLDPAVLAQLQKSSGFEPMIISTHPLKSLQEFLGLRNAS